MRLLTAVATLIAISGPAFASCRGDMPPPRLVGIEPVSTYHVVYLSADMMIDLCEAYGSPEKRPPLGCTSEERPDEFWIYIESQYQSRAEQLCTLWHEKAHIIGWTHPAYRSGPVYHSLRKGTADVLRHFAEDPR